jgi:capsular polysaccharide transport system permease protein
MSLIKNPVRLLKGRSRLINPDSRGEVGAATPLKPPVGQDDSPVGTVTFESPRRRRRLPRALIGFLLFFVLPSISSIVYFTLIAAPQYAAEARLVVRAAEISQEESKADSRLGGATGQPTGSQTNMSSGGLKYSPTTQNAYIVAQYIRSRAMVEDLSKVVNLREIFRRPEADPVARLADGASIEELVDYWQGMAHSYVDAPSGIVTFQIRAFRAEDALKIADEVVRLSEQLVNQISKRAREDIMRSSEGEVREAAANVRTVLRDLQVARNAEGILDPVKTADETGKLLMQMTTDKIKLEAELFAAMRTLNKDAPSVRNLRSRLEIAEKQLAAMKATMAGNGGPTRNIAASMRTFEELESKRFVAEKLLVIAEEALDRARKRAERQNLYFMVFVPPTLPMEAKFPRRLAYSIIFPLAFLVLWGIGALTAAAIEDHRI